MLRLLLAFMLAAPAGAATQSATPPSIASGVAHPNAAAPTVTPDPSEPPTAADIERDLRRETLGKGVALISQGQPQQAIDQYLDPLLATFTASHADEKRRIYTARSLAESMLYMLIAAGDKTGAIVSDVTWTDAFYFKGYALVELGNFAQARVMYEKAAAMAPSNAMYIAEIGNLDQLAKDWPRALTTFERGIQAAEVSPPDAKQRELTRAMRGAGYSLVELGRFEEAEAMYRKCLALNPEDRSATKGLERIAGLRGAAGKPGSKG